MANYESGGFKYTSATELLTSGYAATWAGSPVEKEVVLCTSTLTAGGLPIIAAGVTLNSCKQNDNVGLSSYGDRVKAVAGGTIAVGDLVIATTGGKFIKGTEQTSFTVALCSTTGSSVTLNTGTANGFTTPNAVTVGMIISGAGISGIVRVADLVDADTVTMDSAQTIASTTLTFTYPSVVCWGVAESAATTGTVFTLRYQPKMVQMT